MSKNNKLWWVFPLVIILSITAISGIVSWQINNKMDIPPEEPEQSLRGRSGPERFIVGTETSTPETFGNDNDFSSIATSSDTKLLLAATDEILFTVETPAASTTNEFHWHIFGSVDDYCDNSTYENVDWYELTAADFSPSGYNNYGLFDVTQRNKRRLCSRCGIWPKSSYYGQLCIYCGRRS